MEKLIKEIKALTPQQASEIKGGGGLDTRPKSTTSYYIKDGRIVFKAGGETFYFS